ncbi:MAG: hypothetical protein GY938_32915 [Ketobacter sp.]|nr:hypothetical protein [Ketobacter sp.]
MAATEYVFTNPVSVEPMDIDQNSANSNSANSVENESKQKAASKLEKYAVVLNRPPGHHCDGQKCSGYCYINNIAVAIEKRLNKDTRVLILDIDVHHGDGTQKLFYDNPNVLTVSFHQYDGTFYPQSGLRTEYGPSDTHVAYGTNINVPLSEGASDSDVLYGLLYMVWQIVMVFKPDIAFYACGTDGIAGDKANNATIFTPNLYGRVASELCAFVSLIVVTTEGGYTTKYLSAGMSAVLKGLSGEFGISEDVCEEDVLPSTVDNIAATKRDLQRVYGTF